LGLSTQSDFLVGKKCGEKHIFLYSVFLLTSYTSKDPSRKTTPDPQNITSSLI
jgi:hypothetical protein